jgi:hypothetical protein
MLRKAITVITPEGEEVLAVVVVHSPSWCAAFEFVVAHRSTSAQLYYMQIYMVT